MVRFEFRVATPAVADRRSFGKDMKLLILFLAPVIAFAASTGAASSIPFYGGGWDLVLGKQFETTLDAKSDRATLDPQSFWHAYGPEKLKAEATAFLKRGEESGRFKVINPDEYEVSITAIRMENLPVAPLADLNAWHVVVELSAWGKLQRSGVPLCFRLVMIPGQGFKTPTLVSKESEKSNKAPSQR